MVVGLLMTGCGFEPVYGDRSGPDGRPTEIQRHLAAVDVTLIANRIGQVLRNELLARLKLSGYRETPIYRLDVTVAELEQQLSVERDATSTRANLRITATFRLFQLSDGALVVSDSVRSVNSFAIQRTTEAVYSTIVAREDARARGLRTVADRIVNRLSLKFSEAADG